MEKIVLQDFLILVGQGLIHLVCMLKRCVADVLYPQINHFKFTFDVYIQFIHRGLLAIKISTQIRAPKPEMTQNAFNALGLPKIFLDASTHLYKRVCPCVRWSVRLSVGPSVVAPWSRVFFLTAEFDWKLPRITEKVT